MSFPWFSHLPLSIHYRSMILKTALWPARADEGTETLFSPTLQKMILLSPNSAVWVSYLSNLKPLVLQFNLICFFCQISFWGRSLWETRKGHFLWEIWLHSFLGGRLGGGWGRDCQAGEDIWGLMVEQKVPRDRQRTVTLWHLFFFLPPPLHDRVFLVLVLILGKKDWFLKWGFKGYFLTAGGEGEVLPSAGTHGGI